MMLQARDIVPSFQLYGDVGQTGLPDLVHIEPLRDRSRLHDWNIKPHRHSGLLQIFSFQTTDVAIRWEDRIQALNCPAVLMIPPGIVHGFSFTPRIVGTVTTIPTELLRWIGYRSPRSSPLFLTEHDEAHGQLTALLSWLNDEYQSRRPDRDRAIRALIDLCMTWVFRSGEASDRRSVGRIPPTRQEQRLEAFLELVEENYANGWNPARYADGIGISKAQLTRDCRAIDGRSPLQIVHDRVIREAHRKLAYTQWSVGAISDALGFSDVGYFSRFYKRLTGETPTRYRSRMAERVLPKD